jgi:hypothetical protein
MSTNNAQGVTVTGSPEAVARALALLNGSAPPPPAGNAVSATSGTGSGAGCDGTCNTPNPVAATQGNQAPSTGALAAQSACLTTGAQIRTCGEGRFPAYTAQAPMYITKTPTRRDFDVPCLVASSFFAMVAMKCKSTESLVASLQVGSSLSSCCGTQIVGVTQGTTAEIEIGAEAGCEIFTPGILFTVGFSQNVAPGPISISVSGTGSDGCPFDVSDIRMTLTDLGQGLFALIFNCEEEGRLYPVLARLRNAVVQIPTGTTIEGIGGPTTAPVFFADETITINVVAPGGTTVTIETLAWNHPALTCLWHNALEVA